MVWRNYSFSTTDKSHLGIHKSQKKNLLKKQKWIRIHKSGLEEWESKVSHHREPWDSFCWVIHRASLELDKANFSPKTKSHSSGKVINNGMDGDTDWNKESLLAVFLVRIVLCMGCTWKIIANYGLLILLNVAVILILKVLHFLGCWLCLLLSLLNSCLIPLSLPFLHF